MSRKHKRRAAVQPMRSVRSIREIGINPGADSDYEINDGEEFQARDGSNVKTMAEAEAEARRDLRLAVAPAAKAGQAPEKGEGRTIGELVWRLVTSPARLVASLVRIPFAAHATETKGNPA